MCEPINKSCAHSRSRRESGSDAFRNRKIIILQIDDRYQSARVNTYARSIHPKDFPINFHIEFSIKRTPVRSIGQQSAVLFTPSLRTPQDFGSVSSILSEVERDWQEFYFSFYTTDCIFHCSPAVTQADATRTAVDTLTVCDFNIQSSLPFVSHSASVYSFPLIQSSHAQIPQLYALLEI